MSKAVKSRKYLKRHTGNGIEVRRMWARVEAKVEAQRKQEGAMQYDLRQALAKRQLTVDYSGIYNW